MTLFAPAVKERLRARVAFDGPTGAGKTWTALQWARIIAGPDGPIGLIDTENRSAAYYAAAPGETPNRTHWWDPPYVFGHMPWNPPYDPAKLARTVEAAGAELGPDGVLVIDSLTHFWIGEGGTLDVVEAAGDKSRGNRFAGWKTATPIQRNLLDTIVHAPCHVIVTMRSKMQYVLEEVVRNGRTVQQPRKVGMAPVQRDDVEYEFTVVADMDLEHRLVVSKSRCDSVADVVAQPGRSHEPAQTFATWLSTGAEATPNPPVGSATGAPDSTAPQHAAAIRAYEAVLNANDEGKRRVRQLGEDEGRKVTVAELEDPAWRAKVEVELQAATFVPDPNAGDVLFDTERDEPSVGSQWDEREEATT